MGVHASRNGLAAATAAAMDRFNRAQLAVLTDSRPCEICGEPMPDHEWVIMDRMGSVAVCSNEEFDTDG